MKKMGLIVLLIVFIVCSCIYSTACSLLKSDSNTDVDAVKDESGETYSVAISPSRTQNEVIFGQYPQTEMKSESVVTELDKKAGDLPTKENNGSWTSYEYEKNGNSVEMWYKDVIYDSQKYRGVYYTTSRINSEYEYVASRVYWFLYEPIHWSVLDENRGELLLICNAALDSQEYSKYSDVMNNTSTSIAGNNYELSYIRSWLNNTFYNTAFTEKQKKYILSTTVKNSFEGNRYSCDDTNDKVFLLSKEEAYSSRYGFQERSAYSNYGYQNVNNDSARCKRATDYARSQTCDVNTDTSYYAREQRGNACWWLRTPDSDYSGMACFTNYYGSPEEISMVFECKIGVVPVIRIKM